MLVKNFTPNILNLLARQLAKMDVVRMLARAENQSNWMKEYYY